MNLNYRFVALLLAGLSCTFAGDFNHNIYSEYRLMELHYVVPQAKLSYRYNHENYTENNYWNDSLTYSSDQMNSNLSLGLRLNLYEESEANVRDIILQTTLYHNVRDAEYIDDPQRVEEFSVRAMSYNFNLSDDWYFNRSNWATSIDFGFSGNNAHYSNSRERIYSNSSSFYKDVTKARGQDHYLEAGIGSGRVRNVTSVHRALQLVKHLEDQGVDVSTMTSDEVIRLAQALESKQKYAALHFRYNKYYWEHIAAVMDTLGYSLDDLDVYTTMYLNEVTNQLHFGRSVGARWEVGGRLQYAKEYRSGSSFDKTDSLLSEYWDWQEDIYFLIHPQFSWYRPLSLNTQVSFYIGLLGGPSVNERSEHDQQLSLDLGGGYQYDITDRLMFSSTLSYEHNRWNSDRDAYEDQLKADLSFKYYIFDLAHLEMAYYYNYWNSTYRDLDFPPDATHQNGTFQIILSYGPSSPSVSLYN